jgi:hypothetical protein
MYIKYEHRGNLVWVESDRVGIHQRYCMCYDCKRFAPEDKENCKIAEDVFINCKNNHIVTPVWECPEFEELK